LPMQITAISSKEKKCSITFQENIPEFLVLNAVRSSKSSMDSERNFTRPCNARETDRKFTSEWLYTPNRNICRHKLISNGVTLDQERSQKQKLVSLPILACEGSNIKWCLLKEGNACDSDPGLVRLQLTDSCRTARFGGLSHLNNGKASQA
jgi:hypothetical protein